MATAASSFLDEDELREINFLSVGDGVLISRHARFYHPESIEIGSNSRIDDFAILSAGAGGIFIGNHVHVGAHATLSGEARITLSDYCGLSYGVRIFSSTDDFSGRSMTNPTVPAHLRNVRSAEVFLSKHTIVGANSVIMPGVVAGQAVAIGANSFVRNSINDRLIMFGAPARKVGVRDDHLLDLEREIR